MISNCNLFHNRVAMAKYEAFAESKGYLFGDGRIGTLDGALFRLRKGPHAPEELRKDLRISFMTNNLMAVLAFLELHPNLPGLHAPSPEPLETIVKQEPRFPLVHQSLSEVAQSKGWQVTYRRFGEDNEMFCATATVPVAASVKGRYISESSGSVMHFLTQLPGLVGQAA
ncbi:hypothetical protein [Burkholderia cenocepacia]|uniref:hypothetical protein n=1 Tax=Burkholderia cenocepacia TaxID=95486 RepID=UPI00076C445F|nr:hypothetical protein [Burkholderia cenocepacia]KWU26287.1 hypothetical protein AS149_25180 [Burkholderia cenocepacia]